MISLGWNVKHGADKYTLLCIYIINLIAVFSYVSKERESK